MVNYTAKVLIPFKLVGVDALLFFPLIGVTLFVRFWVRCFCVQAFSKMELPDQYIFGGNNVNIKADNIVGIIVDNEGGPDFFLLVIQYHSNPNISSAQIDSSRRLEQAG